MFGSNRLHRYLMLSIAGLFLFAQGCAWQAELDSTRSDLEATREMLQTRDERIRALESNLAEREQTIKTLQEERGDLLESVESMDRELQTTQDKLRQMSLTNDDLRNQRDQAINHLKSIRTQFVDLQQRIDELAQVQSDRLQTLRKQNEELTHRLADVREAKARIEGENVIVTLDSRILFDLGKASLKQQARDTLDSIATILNDYEDRFIGIEGHTDTIPIRSGPFRNNWHLSATRAVTVVDYLIDEHQVNPRRLSATGFGEYRPLYPNRTPEDRALNRRVEIVIYPSTLKREPRSD